MRPMVRQTRSAFTLPELAVALFVVSLLLAFTGALATEVNQLVDVSNETTTANDYASAFERAMREDIEQLTPDQFMVIRQKNVALTAPDADGEPRTVVYASDQLMFFAKGGFRTGRLNPYSPVNESNAAPGSNDDLYFPSDRPVEIINRTYLQSGVRSANETTLREPLPVSGAAARIWYGHLATPAYQRITPEQNNLDALPPNRWSIGRHQLTLVADEPLGLRDPGTNTGSPIRAHYNNADMGGAFPDAQKIFQSFYATTPISDFLTVGDITSISGSDAPWNPNTVLPALWNREFIQGNVALPIDSAGNDRGWEFNFGMAEPFAVPVDMALTSLTEIRRFLRPRTFGDTDVYPSDSQRRAHGSAQLDLMRRACFPPAGTAGFDLASRHIAFGDDDFEILDRPIPEALIDESFDANDEAYLLSLTMIPRGSSFRIEWAGDMDGDGVMDRYTFDQNYRGEGSLIKDSDNDGIDDYIDLDDNDEFNPSIDARIGDPVWYGLDSLSTDFDDVPDSRKTPLSVSNLGDPSVPRYFFAEFNDFSDLPADTRNSLGGFSLFRNAVPPANVDVQVLTHDQVFGYPEEFEGRWPQMLRVTITQRSEQGEIIASNVKTDSELPREILRQDPDLGVDLEALTHQFIIELPRSGN